MCATMEEPLFCHLHILRVSSVSKLFLQTQDLITRTEIELMPSVGTQPSAEVPSVSIEATGFILSNNLGGMVGWWRIHKFVGDFRTSQL